ncbi:MAG: hypothetical protein HY931_04265 [Candidatus Falkowbacteria bacterium]|nr:MAG: hypothetical protein HY931_04265 [Candidatus Falkowbacteria bacterium]
MKKKMLFWRIMLWVDIVVMFFGLVFSAVLMFVKHLKTFSFPLWLVAVISVLGIITAIIAIDRTDREI